MEVARKSKYVKGGWQITMLNMHGYQELEGDAC
jgi:hypothetical protein